MISYSFLKILSDIAYAKPGGVSIYTRSSNGAYTYYSEVFGAGCM